jgi:hypothetical protein
MNKRFKILSLLLALFAAAYGALVLRGQPAALAIPKAAAYEAVFGKPLTDQVVGDFIVSNRCSSASQVQMCHEAGIILWFGLGQEVKAVYLYPNQTRDFGAYKGKLPLGLSPDDTKASVEEKLGQPNAERTTQAGWVPGRPEDGAPSDHFYYWEADQRFGVTIVYNPASATYKDATIYAILVSK